MACCSTSQLPSRRHPPYPWPALLCRTRIRSNVYLTVPNYRHSGLNVSIPNQRADTRYLAEVVTVRDENSGLAEKPVQVARKNYRLLTEGDSRQECSSLPVARVRRTGSGALDLDPHFVPPLLDFAASDYLTAVARRLVEILATKSSMLSGVRRQKNLRASPSSAPPTSPISGCSTPSISHFPEFRHLFETRHGHPETAVRSHAFARRLSDHFFH